MRAANRTREVLAALAWTKMSKVHGLPKTHCRPAGTGSDTQLETPVASTKRASTRRTSSGAEAVWTLVASGWVLIVSKFVPPSTTRATWRGGPTVGAGSATRTGQSSTHALGVDS